MASKDFLEEAPRDPEGIRLGLCRASKQPDRGARADLAAIVALLRSATGQDFSRYKTSSILQGVHARMACCARETIELYTCYLERHPEEILILFRALLIGVTSFFRDAAAFASLQREALPTLLSERKPGSVLRAWVPGCATGEEAYSLAMLLQEIAEEGLQRFSYRIFATDIDEQAIAAARTGIFPQDIDKNVSPRRLERFFTNGEQGYQVAPGIRAGVCFGSESVLTHAPFIQVDLISCRNLFIYLEADLQDALLNSFHRSLRPGGILFLSPSESIGSNMALFTTINRKWKLYRANSLYPATLACLPLPAQAPGSGS